MEKTIVITGASSGIGKATAKRFAQEGWNVIAGMRKPARDTELSALEHVLVVQLDVQDPDTIASAIKAGIQQFGHIDVWVNNAGQGLFGLLETTPIEKISKLFEVNFFGAVAAIQAILPHFRARQKGLLVNISSATGRSTFPLLSAYCASKFALEGLSEALSFELASQHIGVKIIEPGMVETHFNQATESNNATTPVPEDYKGYLKSIIEIYSADTTKPVSAEEAAQVIFEAVTDGTDQLRYTIGKDAAGLLSGRKSMGDQEFMDLMRKRFTV
jgi:NAD(P)-dependent dehydrogenase (short-subunit alcohol dehydrogenase family)